MSNSIRQRSCGSLTAILLVSAWNAIGAPSARAQSPVTEAAAGDPALRDYLSGNGLLNRGLYELAVAEYRKFLSANSQHAKAAAARYGLAVALYRLDRFEEALIELAPLRGRADFEFAVEVSTIAGHCELALNRYAAAAASFRAVGPGLASHELADDAAAGAVEASYLAGQHDDALSDVRTFETRFPQSPLVERVLHFGGLAEMVKLNYPAAAERFERLLNAYPKGPLARQANLLLAQCLQRSDAVERAAEQYRRILADSGPFVADALAGLGSLLYDRGQYDEAGKHLDRLIREFADSPHVPLARFQRARVRFEQGRFDEARAEFEPLAAADTFADEAAFWAAKCDLRVGDPAAAAKRLTDALACFPKSALLPEMTYDRAVALLRVNDLDAATAGLQEFRSRHPEHPLAPEALRLLASAEHQRGAFAVSKAHCLRFLAEYPRHDAVAELAFLSAENDFLAGDTENAARGFEHYVQAHPRDPQALKAKFRLGLSLYRLEQFDEAAQWLSEVVDAARGDALLRPALLALGDIHFHRGEWKQAETLLSVYADFPDEPSADDAMLKLALARQRQERLDDALNAYARLLKQFPQSAHRVQASFERGQCLVALKRLDEAAAAFESVAADAPGTTFAAHALNQLAAIASSSGQTEKAAAIYAQLAEKAPEGELQESALFQRAQALTADGKFSEAQAAYDDYLRRFATGPHAAEAGARRAMALARQDRHPDALAAMETLGPSVMASLPSPLRAALLYEKGWCLRAVGRTDDAARAFREVEEEPSPAGYELHAMLELAAIESAAQRWKEAVTILERLRAAIADRSPPPAEPLPEQCLYRLAAAQFALGNFDKAAPLFEVVVTAYPQSAAIASAHYYAGESAFKLGKFDKAVSHFTRVVKEHKDHEVLEPSLLRLGESLAQLQRWALSEQTFATCLDRFGGSDSALQAQFGVGWARENQQRYEEAMAAYAKVVAGPQTQTAARAQFQIGQCLFAQQKFEDASRELLKVDILYAYPEWSAAALFEAARCFERLGKTAEARAQLEQVEQKYRQTQWAAMAAKRLSELSSAVALPGR
jgi:TolA-binding protein